MLRMSWLTILILVFLNSAAFAQEKAQDLAQKEAQKEMMKTDAETDIFALRTGAADFRHYCAVCHGTDAAGNGPLAAELVRQPADLTGLRARNDGVFPAARVFLMIDGRADVRAHGPREMPVWGQEFTRDESGLALNPEAEERITNLVDYLRTLQVD